LGNNSEFTLIHIKNLVDICVVPRVNYSYGLDGADEVEDKRKIAIAEEETPVVQQTLPLAQSIVEVPVNTSELTQSTSALPDLTAVPTDNVAQLNAMVNSNHAQFSANMLFLQEVINTITPSFVCHSQCI
jgi:hypothetical protein